VLVLPGNHQTLLLQLLDNYSLPAPVRQSFAAVL